MCTTFLFFSGLRFFALAEATTILFISPILLIVISPFMLGERPRKKDWLMVVIGFTGMIIMLRPTSELLRPAILLPLGAACSFTIFQIITRKLNKENPFTTLFYTGVVGFIILSAAVPFYWTTPDIHHLPFLLLLGILGAIGHFLLIKAFSYASAPVLAPFVYTQLIWATLLGLLFFAEFPDMWSLIGMSIIGITGLMSSRQGNFPIMEADRRKMPGRSVAVERRAKIFKRQRRV
jgi:drug/metabolite transporter (DMT)-like permease